MNDEANQNNSQDTNLCPCCSGLDKDDCCAPFLAGTPAPTALALMRSRYTAYATGYIDYIKETCSPALQADFSRAETESFSKNVSWQGLDILRVAEGGTEDCTGQVEFIARYAYQGKNHTLHELSDFTKIDGHWFYSGGIIHPQAETTTRAVKTGRNDPCPCGSGKKFKKCCGDHK